MRSKAERRGDVEGAIRRLIKPGDCALVDPQGRVIVGERRSKKLKVGNFASALRMAEAVLKACRISRSRWVSVKWRWSN